MSKTSMDCMLLPLWVAVTGMMTLLCGCAPSNTVPVVPPAGWILVDAQPFTFYAPADMKAVPVQGIDSLVGQYNGSAFSLNFDYGMYSDPLKSYEDRPGYAERAERIDGRKAKVVAFHSPDPGPFPETIAVHFPKVDKQSKLTMVATCKTKEDADAALTVFRTIRFK